VDIVISNIQKLLQNIFKNICEKALYKKLRPGTEAHTYNPSYLGGKNQEDQGLRPAWAKSLQDHISTNKS
jgi:hypothetical protein